MTGLDGLDWTAAASVQAFGVTFGIRVNDAAVLPQLLNRLPPGAQVSETSGTHDLLYSVIAGTATAETTPEPLWRVYAGDEEQALTANSMEAFEAFEGAVRFEVAQRADPWTFVHAGAVGWNGRAILIPGVSYSGKSRLIEALVRAGATYYSDEYAVLDARGLVHPYARAITLRRESGGIDRINVQQPDGAATPPPIPVGMVVSTRFVAGTVAELSEISGAAALMALLTNTVRAQVAPGPVMATLARAVDSVIALEGPRGDALATAHELLRRASLWPPTTGEMA